MDLDQLVNALIASRLWASSLLFLTYDEGGGYFDHVAPPQVDAYGMRMRVPTLVISPWVKRGYVSGHSYEHSSILKFVEDRENTTGVSMLEFNDKPVLQAKPFQKRLLWISASVMAILLFTIIFRLIRARAGKMLQPPQKANEVLAIITNSGSTNTPGSTLTILKDGSGSLTYQKGAQEERFSRYVNKTFPRGTFESNQLENMLTQIKDVGTIPNRDCLKSVSFGSTTTITYQGKTSGDLSCLSNEDPKIFLDLKNLVQSMFTHV